MTSSYLNDCVIIGQGKAGDALRRSLCIARKPISGIISQSVKGAIDTIPIYTDLEKWAEAHPRSHRTFFIAWPDGLVRKAIEQIIALSIQPKAIIHLSGVCDFKTFHELPISCPIASFHPNAVLNKGYAIPKNTTIGLEVAQPDLKLELERLANQLELSTIDLTNVDRRPYHLAAVHVANLACVLMKQGVTLWTEQGLDAQAAQKALAQLLRTCAERIEHTEPENMLTGPVARGDTQTIQKHMSFLNGTSQHEETKKSYRLLSTQLLHLTQHSPQEILRLAQALKNESN